MSSDIEMLDVPNNKLSSKSPVSGHLPSTSSRQSSISLHDRIDNIDLAARSPAFVPIHITDEEPIVNGEQKPKPVSTTKPASTAKPKSTKPVRPRSPSPSPPPPPAPPLQTIRLDIKLGGPDNYEVDISNLAKATGQRPPTPVPVKRDTSDSEGDDEGEAKEKPKKKKKKNIGTEYYDVHDPFIDDSELAVDERTWFAQTKQQGFYVSSGEVALLKDKTPKKPKSKKVAAVELASASAGPSTLKQEGTKDAPIALTSDNDDDKTGHKRKRYLTIVENGKKRKIIDVHSFHPTLQASIDVLREAIAKESWEVKGKFPPALKPVLVDVAIQAIKLEEYDDHFFNLMPTMFPYNKFTMTKLIKRTVFPEHIRLLTERQDDLLGDLAVQASVGLERAEEEWNKNRAAWDKRQEKARADAEAAGGVPEDHLVRQGTEDAGSGADGDGAVPERERDGTGVGREPHAPTRRYRLTEAMKATIWQLVVLSNECCRLENEKNTLEGSILQVSEQGLRKILYQKIVAAYPVGWMSSGQISREVSSIKKRLEKEAMEGES